LLVEALYAHVAQKVSMDVEERLHPLWRGVYAVGRPEVSDHGRWMAAVLACGPGARLSHGSAAALWGLLAWGGEIDIVVPGHRASRRPGICVHRRFDLETANRCEVHGISVTDPITTLIDVTTCKTHEQVERAIREADRLDLVDPESLRQALDASPPRPGVGPLRSLLDRHTFALTDSVLEQHFLRLVRVTGLPIPKTQAWVNGFRVDFHWPELGLVVETDGLHYHRTPAQQAKDQFRDQAHAKAGLTVLRFTAAQVRYDPDHVQTILTAVASRLAGAP
jgi:very-short-patch-repair endonuclease